MKELSWKNLFPHKTPRDQQINAIEKIINDLEQKRFFALEAGTGVGKSAVGLTIARKVLEKDPVEGYEKGAIFVTTQKLLQDQYEKDFSKLGMKSIKSSTNYKCRYKKHISCSQGQTEIRTEIG